MKKLILFTLAFSLIGCKTMKEKAPLPVYEHEITQEEIDSLPPENLYRGVIYSKEAAIAWGENTCKSFTVTPDKTGYPRFTNQFIVTCVPSDKSLEKYNDR